MNSEKKLELIEVEYWTCHNENHRHKTLAVAEKCIKKHESKPRKKVKRWTHEMLLNVLDMRDKGVTFREIGEAYQVSANRARQVHWKANMMRMGGRL